VNNLSKIILKTQSWNFLRNPKALYCLKGTVQRKLTGVLSGINRQLMISQSVAWYFFFNLRLGPLNQKNVSQRLNKLLDGRDWIMWRPLQI
jgi:hypothetical protein